MDSERDPEWETAERRREKVAFAPQTGWNITPHPPTPLTTTRPPPPPPSAVVVFSSAYERSRARSRDCVIVRLPPSDRSSLGDAVAP